MISNRGIIENVNPLSAKQNLKQTTFDFVSFFAENVVTFYVNRLPSRRFTLTVKFYLKKKNVYVRFSCDGALRANYIAYASFSSTRDRKFKICRFLSKN